MSGSAGIARKTLSLLIALVLVNVLLLAPQWLRDGSAAPWVALESVLIVGLFAVLPKTRGSTTLAAIASGVLVLLGVLVFADTLAHESLGRELNLYLDIHLARSVYHMMTGTLGLSLAVLIVVGVTAALSFVTWLMTRLMSPTIVPAWNGLTRTAAIAVIVLSVAALARETAPALPGLERHVAFPAVRLITDQSRHLTLMLNEHAVFASEIAEAPDHYADVPDVLQHLRNRDVLLAFVESYGVSAIDDPRYAPIVRPRLKDLAARVSDAGLHVATGQFVAPTQGGQSWFSHLSLLSGLWVDNQLRYDLLLASGRETLIDDFRRAGHRTVALMPANTLEWPEGERLGYDEILARHDIDYAGPALNWVTMPDQFTWSYLEQRVRNSADDNRPVFVELGLISSHAPWTPILPVLDDWDSIGDGSVFRPWRDAGERPRDLWRDHDRVREHFALSLDYAINVVIGYSERYVDDHTLLIVMGDHQPAPLITGDDASRAVPVHVISGDTALLEPFWDLGFSYDALPRPGQPPLRMDAFRDWFIRAFSAPWSKDTRTSG